MLDRNLIFVQCLLIKIADDVFDQFPEVRKLIERGKVKCAKE